MLSLKTRCRYICLGLNSNSNGYRNGGIGSCTISLPLRHSLRVQPMLRARCSSLTALRATGDGTVQVGGDDVRLGFEFLPERRRDQVGGDGFGWHQRRSHYGTTSPQFGATPASPSPAAHSIVSPTQVWNISWSQTSSRWPIALWKTRPSPSSRHQTMG